MAESPVLVIAIRNVQTQAFAAQSALLRARHANAKLILLTSPRVAEGVESGALCDEIWPEASVRGLWRLLALMRRMSWAGISDIYDLEQNAFTGLLRLSVWPRPHWHAGRL